MKKSKVSFTFTHPSLEIDYHVDGFIHHGAPGQRVGSARFQEPDEPDEWEFISATMVVGGKVFAESDFSDAELELIEKEAFENAEIQDWDEGDSAMERGVKFHQDFFSNQN